MSYWNYRIFKNELGGYYISEVHYNKGKPWGYSDKIAPYGESVEELKEDLELMIKALDKSVLTSDDIEQGGGDETIQT